MKAGDTVQTPKGEGIVSLVGGKPPGTVNPEYPYWEQEQIVVVLIGETKYLFAIDEINE